MARRFKLTMDGKICYATMEDNSFTQGLANACPFEQEFQRNTENKYYTRLNHPLSDDRCDMISQVKRNMICYFKDWSALNLIFVDCDISPFKVVYLGAVEDDISEYLWGAGDSITIKWEEAEESV